MILWCASLPGIMKGLRLSYRFGSELALVLQMWRKAGGPWSERKGLLCAAQQDSCVHLPLCPITSKAHGDAAYTTVCVIAYEGTASKPVQPLPQRDTGLVSRSGDSALTQEEDTVHSDKEDILGQFS